MSLLLVRSNKKTTTKNKDNDEDSNRRRGSEILIGGGGRRVDGIDLKMEKMEAAAQMEKPHHYTYLRDFRTKQCPDFLLHKCTQHRPFTCFNWHFSNQKRRRPNKRRDGTFNYSSDNYCSKYDETTGICPDGEECSSLHRTAGDTERRYHLRYYKTCPCIYETDARGHCVKNGLHCAFAHGPQDLRKPVYDIEEEQASEAGETQDIAESPLTNSLETDRLLNENPVWNDPMYVLIHYKTEACNRPLRLCRQGYACPSCHNPRDKRRSPAQFKYRSTPCPNVKQGDEWNDPSKCENGDGCGYCHTRTEQQFHPEIYKSSKCNDMVQTGYCPRGLFCAFAHVENELNFKWEIPVNNCKASSSMPAAFAKASYSTSGVKGSVYDDTEAVDGIAQPDRFNEERNAIPLPRKFSLIEYGDMAREDDMSGESERPAMFFDSTSKGRLSSALSSSLNDSFLLSMKPSLKSSSSSAKDSDPLPPTDSFRQCTMSVGSYQQYQQMQQNRAKKHLQFSGLLPSGNVTSRYFPSAVPPTSINPLASGSLFVPTQPIEPSAPLSPLQTTISEALASGFFAREATTEPSVDLAEDDLDLNLSDLNSALDQEFQKSSNINHSYNKPLSSFDSLQLSSPHPVFPQTLPKENSTQLPSPSCNAWMKEAETQGRLLKQVEEERDLALKIRDSALSKVVEMKHEIDLLSGRSSLLQSLQQDVNFQQIPMTSLQQIHSNLQHDYNLVEQKLAEMSLCYICKERPSGVVLHPCSHCVVCFNCSTRTIKCPACGMFIAQRSSLSAHLA